MSGSSTAADRAEPNLTPILDMVFQLITFFMLVINFKTASMDMDLRLPAIGSAKPVAIKGQDLLVLNVNRRGVLRVMGAEIEDVPRYIAKEAQASLFAARRYHPELKPGDDLPSMVVIRADKRTPFKLLNRIILSCQENGYRSFSLRALSRKDEQ